MARRLLRPRQMAGDAETDAGLRPPLRVANGSLYDKRRRHRAEPEPDGHRRRNARLPLYVSQSPGLGAAARLRLSDQRQDRVSRWRRYLLQSEPDQQLYVL